jgi:uncharacterized protein YdiU (UPF0061 family)
MNRYALFAALSIAAGSLTFAQDASSQAALIAARQEAAERDRLFNSAIENLQNTVNRQQSEINKLVNRNNEIERELRDTNAKFREALGNTVTQKQLQALIETITKVDKNRLADRDLFIEQLKEIKKIAAEKPAPIVVAPPPVNIESRPDKDKTKTQDEEPVLTNPNGYYAYTVKSKDNLTAIVAAYNTAFKEQGKASITIDQVKKANPKINPNNIPVGKVLQIPIPSDK